MINNGYLYILFIIALKINKAHILLDMKQIVSQMQWKTIAT